MLFDSVSLSVNKTLIWARSHQAIGGFYLRWKLLVTAGNDGGAEPAVVKYISAVISDFGVIPPPGKEIQLILGQTHHIQAS